jgi:nucleoside-diphosphate-sugar epimerase
MKANLIEVLERQELIQKLIDKGYGPLIEALLMNEGKVYTKKGRLNKSGACRVLGWKPKELEDALNDCREILRADLSLDDD